MAWPQPDPAGEKGAGSATVQKQVPVVTACAAATTGGHQSSWEWTARTGCARPEGLL